jgi:Flp pilus assembly protein TadD
MKKETQIEKLLEVGVRHFEKKNFALALQSFLDAQQIDEQTPQIQYYLGIVYARTGSYREAQEYPEAAE